MFRQMSAKPSWQQLESQPLAKCSEIGRLQGVILLRYFSLKASK